MTKTTRILGFASAALALLLLAQSSPAVGQTPPDIAVEKTSQAGPACLAGQVDLSVTGSGGSVEEPEPADLVTILDRSGSMTSADMTNAKDGVTTLLEYLAPELHRVGLGVLPGGRTSPPDPCDGAATSPEPPEEDFAIYLPVGLSDDYQNPDGTLDESSPLVSTILCLEADGYTNIGSPMAAAIDELRTNGRSDVKWGIILLSDGVANRPRGGDTGWRSPTENAAASGGDNNGFQTGPTNAYADGGSYAEDTNSGTNTSTGCGDASKDRHDFYNYGISVPGGNSVVGIQVRLDARVDSTTGTVRRMCVQLSWDGGATWTAAQQTSNLGTSFQNLTLGASDDDWGHNWTPAELSDANFRVRITNVSNNNSRTFRLDWVAVRVYHSAGVGPCEYAADQADRARAAGIEVFTIGYGLHDPDNPGGNYCNYDDTGGWADRPGWELLEYMATDADHFFDQSSTADLRPIFEIIGATIAPIAGEDVTVIDVLPSNVHFVVNSAMIDGVGPASQPAISDAGHTLTWELGPMTISDAHHISFQVTFDSAGDNVLADVYPDSRVEFVDYLGQAQTRPFPETRVDIPVCGAVGGMLELQGAPTDRSALQSGAESPPYIALAAMGTVALLALTAGAWYARRRCA